MWPFSLKSRLKGKKIDDSFFRNVDKTEITIFVRRTLRNRNMGELGKVQHFFFSFPFSYRSAAKTLKKKKKKKKKGPLL